MSKSTGKLSFAAVALCGAMLASSLADGVAMSTRSGPGSTVTNGPTGLRGWVLASPGLIYEV